jgi:hypothetical protein
MPKAIEWSFYLQHHRGHHRRRLHRHRDLAALLIFVVE